MKTLEKLFNDVYNKRELYINSKRLSLYVYKNKTKTKNTADKCIKIYYVSWFTYLKLLHNLSVPCCYDWRQGFFFLIFFYYCSLLGAVSPSVWCPRWKPELTTSGVLGRRFISNCRIRKGEKKNLGHIPADEPEHPSSFCFTECIWDTQT